MTPAILILVGVGNARSKPVVRQMTLHMPGLPDGFRPTKVALLGGRYREEKRIRTRWSGNISAKPVVYRSEANGLPVETCPSNT